MADIIHTINLIASNPDVRGGQPCIAGTGLRVSDIVTATLFHDQNPGEIAAAYGVSLAQVHAALAYYYEHKDEIDSDLRRQFEEAKSLKEKRVGGKSPFLFG